MTRTDSPDVAETSLPRPDGRRLRLREFQARLLESMQAAQTGVQSRTNRLGLMVGGSRWLMNLQEAGEIVPVGPVSGVPLTREWFLGLSNVRGSLVSVVDLSHFLGGAPTAFDKDCRVVVFASAMSLATGLLVSRVMGLRNISDMTPQPVGADEAARWCSARYVDRDEQVWNELNVASMVQDQEFLNVGL